jgi:hypothetical protein
LTVNRCLTPSLFLRLEVRAFGPDPELDQMLRQAAR